MTVTSLHASFPPARRAPALERAPGEQHGDVGSYREADLPVAALRLPAPVLRVVAPLLEDAGFAVLDITAHERGPRPHLIVLELPQDEEEGRRLLARPLRGPGRLFLAPGDLGDWATLQWAGDEIVRSPFHRLQVVAAALRVGRRPAQVVADWSQRAFDDLRARGPLHLAGSGPARSACA
ncbi:MAG: hypothetical protein QOI54_2763 [Actinomycetota bacterium]|nr:hypothetical protein [Actinomycetota bacterium]